MTSFRTQMAAKKSNLSVVRPSRIDTSILVVREQRVLLDRDLAGLYGVETRALNQAVRRNRDRFPADFMFELTWRETEQLLRSQSVILDAENDGKLAKKRKNPRSQPVILESGQNIKYRPLAFTEQGVAMLSTVLSSPRAVQVNIEIMRAFVRLRQLLNTHADLAKKLARLEKKYDVQFKAVFEAIRDLMATPPPLTGGEMGFHTLMPGKPAKKISRKRSS